MSTNSCVASVPHSDKRTPTGLPGITFAVFATLALLFGPSAFAETIDPCLTGTWQATSVITLPQGTPYAPQGGTGFHVTFKTDGTQIIDYTEMVPFTFKNNERQIFKGTASGRISTSNHVATLEEIAFAKVTLIFSTLSETPEQPLGESLGPGGLGTTKSDNKYICFETALEYKTSLAPDKHPNFLVKLARMQASNTAASAAPPPTVAVNGSTWLTATEIKNRIQDIDGLWRETPASQDSEFVWQSTSPTGRLIDHPVSMPDSDPQSIDMQATGDLQWQGRVFVCPLPKGKCENLCQWDDGSIRMDPDHLTMSFEWHGKKYKSDCSGFEDRADSGTFLRKRVVGVSFVPLAPGKYMSLVGAPAVGNQAAQFKAVVRIAADYDDLPNTKLRATADQGKLAPADGQKGTYEFLAEKSGVYELTFELLAGDGKPFHTDRMRIAIPAIPGLGN